MIDSRRARKILLIITLLGFGLRIGTILMLRSWQHPSAMEHRSIAMGLVKGNGFAFGDFGYYGPTSYQSPPYPLFLAGLFRIFGIDSPAAYAAAMVVNAILSSAAIWFTYTLARTLGATEGVGLLASAACALWPAQIYAVTHVQAVAMITLGVTVLPILFYKAVRSGDLRPWIGFSAVGCLLALTEPVLLPILALSGIVILGWRGLSTTHRIRFAGTLFLAACVILLPWTIRNRLVHGRWVPVKSAFWMNVWKGNNDKATGTDRPTISDEVAARLRSNSLSLDDAVIAEQGLDTLRQQHFLTAEQLSRLYKKPEIAREAIFKEYAQEWIRTHPGRYLKLCMIRLWKTLWIDSDNPKSYNLIYIVSRSLLLVLSIIGAGIAIRNHWSLTFPLAVFASCLLLYSLTITAARFSIPFEPFQLCLTAEAIVAICTFRRPAASPVPMAVTSVNS